MNQISFFPSQTWNLRSSVKVEEYRKKLMEYHDELADLKSYFDSCKGEYDQATLF